MLHNAIEHSGLQLIAEKYNILSNVFRLALGCGGLLQPLELGIFART
jgi:hypothetical protein